MSEEELKLEEFKRLWSAANIKAEPYHFEDYDETNLPNYPLL